MARDAPAELLEWDSAFWDMTVGRVVGNALDEQKLADVDSWAEARGVDCLYFLAAADSADTIRTAQSGGFRVVDVRVQLSRSSSVRTMATSARPYRPADLDDLRRIARTRHENTRFYADGRFPRERCADLYETWIVASCEEDFADGVLVAEVEGRACGYVTLRLDADGGRGSIELIAVAADAEAQGVGTDLVAGALDWLSSRGAGSVTVVTQGSNVASQRLYQRSGFRTASVGIWLHRWQRA